VIVAPAHAVEHRARELESERRAVGLLDGHVLLESAAPKFELDERSVDVDLVRDDVAQRLAVHREHFVARDDSGPRREGFGRDGQNASGRHRARIVRPDRRAGLGSLELVPVDQVLLAEPRGFCAGVEMAIKALAWMVRAFEPPVYCYHEIVHNRLVVDRFRDQGVIFVDDLADVPAGAPLMLSAHGSPPEVVEAARANGGYVVNAVCPLVTKVHHEAKVRARKGFTILYVGHAGHDEAVGTVAVAPDAIRLVERVDDLADAAAGVADPERVAVLAQTTLAQNEWSDILDGARDRFPTLWTASRNDLCFATTNRQQALTEIAHRADAVVVIGSANSSNTIALTKVAREAGCATVLRIDGPEELDLRAIGDARVVGVTAGASAPEELVDAVIAKLAPAHGVEGVRVTDEDEYFPPPRELRELVPALDAIAALVLGGDPTTAGTVGGPFCDDRTLDASQVLAAFTD
jgi:4-hydroxy-3-methylbut-2-en-1-yl diphosphate reductase